MRRTTRRSLQRMARRLALACLACSPSLTQAADPPPVNAALGLHPVQAEVEFDTPDAAGAAKCTVVPVELPGITGWEVRSENNQLLRRFLDTNADRKLDLWCYYKNGIEVYRDIDSDFNQKADQYRWLGTAGIRWGIDEDQDRQIDAWQAISPEEVTAEVVAALATRDATRFERLLLTDDELQSLGLPEALANQLKTRLQRARTNFAQAAGAQQVVTATSRWIHFGGSQPGVIPAGTEGLTKDIQLYDNVSAVVEEGEKHAQVQIGALVQAGGCWRLVDLPISLDPQQATEGNPLYQLVYNPGPLQIAGAAAPELTKLITSLTEIEKNLSSAKTPAEKARLNGERADVLVRIIDVAPADDRLEWISTFSDTIGAAVRTGDFPNGVQHLTALLGKLEGRPEAAPVEFTKIAAEYDSQMADPKADHAKIHQAWLTNLQQFVSRYPQANESAEALLALAFAEEFGGNQEKAVELYKQVVGEFGDSEPSRKAAGAIRRLESPGKVLELEGKTLEGSPFRLSALRGKPVVIYYWATWCDRCVQSDLETLKEVQAKYARQGLTVVAISCDNTAEEVQNFLKTKRLPWIHVYEPGGLESRIAEYLGVEVLPTMILVGKDGKVANNGLDAKGLDDELKTLLR